MKYAFCIGIWLFVLLPSIAQQTSSSAPIQNTQQQVADLERSNRILREDLNRLQKDHDDLKENFDEYEPLLKNWQWLFGGLGIAGLLGWFLALRPYVKSKVEKEVDETIKSLLSNRRKDFLSVLDDYDHDRRIKEKHTLILLTPQKCSDTYHFDLLTKHGLTVKPITGLQQLNEAQFAPGDVLIINDEVEHWKKDEVEAFIHAHPNMCFYIGKERIITTGEVSSRFAAANFRVQFLGNLMNMLRYN